MLASKEIMEDNIEYITVANPRAGRVYLLNKFTNLATLDAQLSLQTVTQPNGSQSLLIYPTCLYINIVCPGFHQAISKRHIGGDVACLT